MNILKGDCVRVNLAPFIGSITRSEETIACEVLAADGVQVHVRALPPCRPVALWVLSDWIEGPIAGKEELVSAHQTSA